MAVEKLRNVYIVHVFPSLCSGFRGSFNSFALVCKKSRCSEFDDDSPFNSFDMWIYVHNDFPIISSPKKGFNVFLFGSHLSHSHSNIEHNEDQ